jgi:hypothetical protein
VMVPAKFFNKELPQLAVLQSLTYRRGGFRHFNYPLVAGIGP